MEKTPEKSMSDALARQAKKQVEDRMNDGVSVGLLWLDVQLAKDFYAPHQIEYGFHREVRDIVNGLMAREIKEAFQAFPTKMDFERLETPDLASDSTPSPTSGFHSDTASHCSTLITMDTSARGPEEDFSASTFIPKSIHKRRLGRRAGMPPRSSYPRPSFVPHDNQKPVGVLEAPMSRKDLELLSKFPSHYFRVL